LQTDCGGMVITQSKVTYEEAAKIADAVDLDDICQYLRDFRQSDHFKNDSCYFHEYDRQKETWTINKYTESSMFHGILWVAVYRYLVDRKLVPHPGAGRGYDNTLEWLFERVLDRLVKAGIFSRVTKRSRMFPKMTRTWFDITKGGSDTEEEEE
jgi:hypothetical protein